MKRSLNQIVLTAALLLTLGVTTSFAANTTDNASITASFHKDFKQAELLSTDAGKEYTKITFKLNGAILIAFYSDNGELLAITHNILPTQLPIALLMQVKNEHADCWITDCFEFVSDGATNYFISLENADTKLVLRSNGNQWDTYNRIAKN